MASLGRILVVDDNRLNQMVLTRSLNQEGYAVATAADGREALDLLRQPPSFDVVLLDILMPELDSVVRCIELGATDYLPKPFNTAILRARIGASLTAKRLRDLELEYLEQVGYITAAAAAVEVETFDPASLDGVAARADALGQLARVFQRMAREVRTREERLQREVRELRIEIDEAHQARQVAEIT